MRLTHHHQSSRSFIILIIVVLCAVFTALVLTRIQRLYNVEPQLQTEQTQTPPQAEAIDEAVYNVTEWQPYTDSNFPLQIEIPKGWEITPNTDFDMAKHLELKTPDKRTVIRIFISEKSYIAVEDLDGDIQETSTGDDVINFDGAIYATRVGKYYYTYDGSADSKVQDILAHIVDKAAYKQLNSADTN